MNPFKHFDSVLRYYISERAIRELPFRWGEKHRHYHTTTHLIQILQDIEKNVWFNSLSIPEKHALLLAAFFHDIVYDPKRKDNEDASIKYFKQNFAGANNQTMLKTVSDLIETTKYRKRPTKLLEKIFWDADNESLKHGYENQIRIGKLIRKEYSHVSEKEFNKGRIKFFESCKGLFGPLIDKDFEKLIKYYKSL